jgi:hypothetical protein
VPQVISGTAATPSQHYCRARGFEPAYVEDTEREFGSAGTVGTQLMVFAAEEASSEHLSADDIDHVG